MTRKNALAWGLWALFALILAALVLHAPTKHNVTVYRDAALLWASHRDLYDLGSIHGFLYLPQSAMAFLPVTWLPLAAGEAIQRLLFLGFLAAALWKLAARLPARPVGRWPWFFVFTLALIPCSLASARNGQTNLPIAAALLWLTLALADKKWNGATLLLLLTLALKPVAFVPILLVAALYPAMRLRLAFGVALFLALPFLDPHWGYVVHQYGLFWQKMAIAREPTEHGFCDFSGMIWTFAKQPMAQRLVQGIGMVMALAALGLGFLAKRRDPAFASFWIVAVAASYLMLFNPRTETNSYVILGAAALPFLADTLQRRARIETACLIALLLSFGTDSYGNPIYPWTHLWLKAFMASGFFLYLALRVTLRRPLFAVEGKIVRPVT